MQEVSTTAAQLCQMMLCEKAWGANALAGVARKHGLGELALVLLESLYQVTAFGSLVSFLLIPV